MSAPPGKWSGHEIATDVATASELFRRKRFAEPLAIWLQEVDRRSEEFRKLFEDHNVAHPELLSASDLPAIIDAGLLDALRYLPGPPISSDDLANLAEVHSLNARRLRADAAAAESVLSVIREAVDPSRFPWLTENREPTERERDTAIFSSALLLAAQRTLTLRRTLAKDEQERAVRERLKALGFCGQRLAKIANHATFPERGVVSENEVQFGPERADVLVRLRNDKMLPIECKVSNSSVNSYKRLNHDTLAKYYSWKDAFGQANVVPAVILSGVFSPANVGAAQDAGLTIFWSHRLEDLDHFVEAMGT